MPRKKEENKTPQTASEALGTSGLTEVPKRASEMVDQALTIESYEEVEGDYGEYAIMNCKDGSDNSIRVSCGGKVVLQKLRKLTELEALPVVGVIRKVGRYYDLT